MEYMPEDRTYKYMYFNEKPLISIIRIQTKEARDSNIVKEVLKSKQVEIGSRIRRQ